MPLMVSAAAPDEASGRRETRGGTGSAGRMTNHVSVVATTATTNTTPVSAAMRRHSGLRGSTVADPPRLAGSSSAKSAAAMSATRLRRSFSRQRRISARIDPGTRAGNALQSGSLLSTATITSVTSSPSNGRFPVSISNSTQPKAQMSLRLSAGLPFACSGDMYAAVPINIPTPVIIAGDVMVGDIERSEAGA